MFSREQEEKFADLIIWFLTLAVKKGGKRLEKNNVVTLLSHFTLMNINRLLQEKLHNRGYYVLPTMENRGISGDIVLKHIPGIKFDPARATEDDIEKIMEKADDKDYMGWVYTVAPNSKDAAEAGLSPEEFGRELVRIYRLDCPDPIRYWREINRRQTEIIRRLEKLEIDYFRVLSDKTDLKIGLGKDRRWVGLSCNLPGFEIFTAPDYRQVDGVFFADRCASWGNIRNIKNIRFTIRGGRVVDIKAEENEETAKAHLLADWGAARLGEFAMVEKNISTINRFIGVNIFDENYGGKFGSCHIAFGNAWHGSYKGREPLTEILKENIGFNTSGMHIDYINTEDKTITAYLKNGDPLLLYKSGSFQI